MKITSAHKTLSVGEYRVAKKFALFPLWLKHIKSDKLTIKTFIWLENYYMYQITHRRDSKRKFYWKDEFYISKPENITMLNKMLNGSDSDWKLAKGIIYNLRISGRDSNYEG